VKTFHDSKLLIGGTPSIKGVSAIESEIAASDRRVYMVPCHECGDSHALDWANVKWSDDAPVKHEVFGTARPETAFYSCPHCGAVWRDTQKNRNVRKGVWQATAASHGIAGFSLNELASSFPDSKLSRLVEKYLTARHEFDQGEPGALIAFTNSSLGLPYEYKGDTPDGAALRARAEDYAEGTVPDGGLILTAGVDVQHDRLAVVVRAWGRGEESWLVYWGEIFGQTIVANSPVWTDLDALLNREWSGLRIKAASIDSSDGTTADAVYAFVRGHRGTSPTLMAVKGASERDGERREIFSIPKPSIDVDKKSKAAKYGIRPYMVGTGRAKDLLIDGRMKLTGNGDGRIHWYASVRGDYWEQITSEVKAPHRTIRGRKVWQKKAGAHNEALDCEVYALHAARSLKTNLLRPAQWDAVEKSLNRVPAGSAAVQALVAPAAAKPAPVRHQVQQMPGRRQSIRDR
jgi:phage terminase large subunit GpA-like protein